MSSLFAHAPVAWYVVRAAGLVALGTLTLSVWLGLAMSTRLLRPKHQKALLGWHRTLAWTGLSMLVLHAGALLFDPTLHFRLPALLVPFVAPWRPAAIAAGVVGGTTRASRRSSSPWVTHSRRARTCEGSAGRSSSPSPPGRSSGSGSRASSCRGPRRPWRHGRPSRLPSETD